jgi:hypothetical protein
VIEILQGKLSDENYGLPGSSTVAKVGRIHEKEVKYVSRYYVSA